MNFSKSQISTLYTLLNNMIYLNFTTYLTIALSSYLICVGGKHHQWLNFISWSFWNYEIHTFPLGSLFFLLNYIYFLYKTPWISKFSKSFLDCFFFFFSIFPSLLKECLVRYKTQLTGIFPQLSEVVWECLSVKTTWWDQGIEARENLPFSFQNTFLILAR